ncbi:MAG: family 1 encapsulin nanocompartment shell protein [Candidatus Cloacimonadota bacterium]|nr:family 1 encapsulin nanocompartment shell protein [Candidatus Cloacimonadota bacterium]
MNFLKKELAPLTQTAWEKIEEQARITLKNNLTARKFITIAGQQGWDFPGISTGRIKNIKNRKNMSHGVREFRPVIEVRTEFELDIWEMDNADRGAADIELGPLEAAAEEAAKFEDDVIYNGFKQANIEGLIAGAEESVTLDPKNWGKTVSEAVLKMKNSSIKPPYALVLGDDMWKELISEVKGYPVKRHIENLIDGPIISTPAIKDGLLVQLNSEDIILTPGQDFSLGYQSHTEKKVKLFLTETFTFSIYEPKAVLHLKMK